MIKEKFGLTNEEGKLMAKVARRSHHLGEIPGYGVYVGYDSGHQCDV